MEPIGKLPIAAPVLLLGKVAVAGCIVFAILKHRLADILIYDSLGLQIAALVLACTGFVILALGLYSLGRSVAVGLPEEKTELKTGGIYGLTRNPMYLGGYILCVSSCLYALHAWNILCCLLAISIHHVIITREEMFLQERFGPAWVEYSSHVNRYFGRSKRSD